MGGHSSFRMILAHWTCSLPRREPPCRRPPRRQNRARPVRPVAVGPPGQPAVTAAASDPRQRPGSSSRTSTDDVDSRELDRGARAGLRSLPKDLAEKIARHLVAAGQLLDEDPAAALAHAQYARNLAPRLAVVREASAWRRTCNGDYATALTELRAVRRMTGDPSYLPIMADCERGLGRPERALALAR